ncbi:MAG: GTP cyclohydrolase I FolE [Candidatus Poribacteria bacterium]|jgi:GTP cyclohydrolase I|nr:GTP cyclohydrolase I FolE [Candidatus Poribacteria bacterium]MDP6751056.1 GTP cyclohydrolase I FolE [Candidatus Poribacteria bacterium]MDP6999600.1 GTP cyclohydrolase I FolE [Candidatus Poribacteria bacterium]
MVSYNYEEDSGAVDEVIQEHIRNLIKHIGEDPERQGLAKTPTRATLAIQYLTQGYQQDIQEIVNEAIFDEQYDDMITVKDIEFYSLCEHHILPFFGKCHVGYLPNKKIIGLSKIPRLVDAFARRLQIQERLTYQIAQIVNEVLSPRGVAVVMEAQHMCMMIRGVEKQHSSTITNVMLGAFREDNATRAEFMNSL